MPDPRLLVSVDGEPIEASVLGLLTRIEVRESDADPTLLALRFNAAQSPDGEFSPLDEGIFLPSAKISVQVEAPGGNPVRLFDGFVTHVRPHFETVESNTYVEVLAMDAAVLLNAEERVEAHPDATDADVAEKIFSRYQIAFTGETTGTRHEEKKQLLVQRGTDWELVQRLARRNGFVCYLEPDPQSGAVTAYFRPRAIKDTPQPDLTVLRDDPNLKWLDLQATMSGPARVKGAAIDPIGKRIVRADGAPRLDPLGEALLGDDVEKGLKQAGATGAVGLLRDPFPAEAAIADEGSAATDRALFAVEARGEVDTTLYRGLLRARRPVLIKGIGRMFAGVYYVRAVRTTVDEGVISQTFVAERNALGLSGKEDFGQSAEEVPPQ
ncbi:phage late control D family protein [Sorangium sp. So ce1389]|uniref:phage late control D family protein n=1 Tax=Sorangium sp. So ce1389 TaxID=3133336 RepID=UPI003F6061D2